MTAANRFIVLVVVVVGAAAAFLAPRSSERLAVMEDQEMHEQIISLLEPRLAGGEGDPTQIAILGHAYGKLGNYTKAIELLRRYAALRPNDAGVYAELGEFLHQTGDVREEIDMLNRSITIEPKRSRVDRLAVAYRQIERPDAELDVLERYEPLLEVEGGFLLRLAQLQAARGRRNDAINTLMRPDIVLSGGAKAQDERMTLAALLVLANRSDEAVRLSKQWIAHWREDWLANRLLRIIAVKAPAADTAELADAVIELHPEIRLFLVHGLAEVGARSVALHLLETWTDTNPRPSTIDIAAFASVCLEQGEPAILWHSYGALLRMRAPDDVIVRFSDALAALFGIEALAPFWASLPQAVIARAPLLAAQLAFNTQDTAATKRLLDKVNLVTLDASGRVVWFELLRAVASPDEQLRIMSARQRNGQLPPALRAAYTHAIEDARP